MAKRWLDYFSAEMRRLGERGVEGFPGFSIYFDVA